jgi:ABC-type cobalamin/Fe3+-siderophores transport system ATPase subunit
MPPRKRSNTQPNKPLISFLLNESLAENSNAEAFIVPANRKYNDFGYRIACTVGFRDKNGHITWVEARCAIEGEKDLFTAVGELLSPSVYELYQTDIEKPFRTLLVDAKSYSIMRRSLGESQARRILASLQDIATNKFFKYDRDWPDFYKEEVFSLAMIRSSEAYFAYRKAERVLKGLQELDADARQPFQIELKGAGPQTYFDFQFDSGNFLRGRIAVIIGQNGCGKTSALAKLSKVLADKESRSAEITNRPELNQILAFIHTASVRQFTPSSKEGLARARVFTFNPASPRKQGEDSATTLLVDVARGHDSSGPLLEHLSEILKTEFGDFQVLVPMKIEQPGQHVRGGLDDVVHMPFEKWVRGGEQQILKNAAAVASWEPLKFLDKQGKERKLSLGQQAFLKFILIALANSGPASALIIDEPENFLHPNLISRFMRSLNKILNGTRSIAFVATHSPFVVREVQSAQVHVMRDEDGVLAVRKPLMQTLGANVSSISNEVFGDDLPHHLYEELLEIAEQQSNTFSEALAKYSSELSTEALMRLRRMMEQ